MANERSDAFSGSRTNEQNVELVLNQGSNGDKRATISLPVLSGSEHENAIVINTLLSDTGMTTLDPGLMNTASCTSAITYIDGNEGILRHRGIPIEQLAESSTFLETAFLLVYGELPDEAELKSFSDAIIAEMNLNVAHQHAILNLPSGAHPMAMLANATTGLALFYPESPEQMVISALGKFPVLAAACYRASSGEKGTMVSANPDLTYTENFLRMAFTSEGEESIITPLMARVLDILFILHADHELNCGTATVRTITSSHSKTTWSAMSAALVGGIEALWGDLHGGANEAVIDMLIEMVQNNESVPTFVERVKRKERLLSGFGHRVYKSYDPRARIVKSLADEMLNQGTLDPLFGKALELEELALSSDYFKQRNLYPNVDFYSGLLYHKLGFKKKFSTVLFAVARVAGWLAHLDEYALQTNKKIVRPRQLYTGYTERPYVQVADR